MNQPNRYTIAIVGNFKKELKALSNKYPSMLEDVQGLVTQMEINPFIGSSPGNGFYKIRLAITSKGSGKSGGARIIANIKIINRTVYLVTIYDKSQKETVSMKELKQFVKLIP